MPANNKEFRSMLYFFVSLILLITFYAVNNYLWFKLDNVPPYNDHAHHMAICQSLINFCHFLDFRELKIFFKNPYPPFVYICGAIFNLVFNLDFSYMITNLFFYLVLLVSIYAIGRRIFGHETGILACFLISFYPYIYGATRIFVIDFPLMAMVTMSIFLLLYSEEFSRFKFVSLLMIIFFLGMLTKQSFALYFLGPLIFAVVKSNKTNIWNIVIFIVGGVLPSLAYYGLFLSAGTVRLFETHFENAKLFFSSNNIWSSIFYYLVILPEQMNWINFIVFSVSFILYIFFCKNKFKNFILLWFLVPNFILLFFPLKYPPYILPLLPAAALISAWGISKVKYPALKTFLLILIFVFGVIFHYLLLFKITISARFSNKYINNSIVLAPPYGMAPYREYLHVYRSNDWKLLQNEIFSFIYANRPQGKSEIVIGMTDSSLEVTLNCPWFIPGVSKDMDNFQVLNEWGVKYYILKNNLPYTVFLLSTLVNQINWDVARPIFDFILSVQPIDEITSGGQRYYELIKMFEFPDKSRVYLYTQKK